VPDPVRYCALLKAAFVAIHKTDQRATIMTGGLAQARTGAVSIRAVDFLQRIYAAGAKGYFNAIADHPYISPEMPADDSRNGWQTMFATSPSLRSVMSDHGDSKPIWITDGDFRGSSGRDDLASIQILPIILLGGATLRLQSEGLSSVRPKHRSGIVLRAPAL
jgi:hypothetical protein